MQWVEVRDSLSNVVGQYSYDSDGKRMKKYVPSTGETTVFAYDASGKLVAEYSTVVASAQDAKVAYLTTDHLGSPRINTDQNGAVIARHDYHPFGEEIFTAQRTTGLNYSADSVRKQFTGYERDDESGLDFAQARYVNSAQGRFVTPDELHNDSDVSDPQSWNKYVYVRNSPLNLIDPTGQKAKITISFDKKNKAATIVISASFGIYAQDGDYSTKELAAQAAQLKKQIEDTYKGSFKLDGITYTVSANVTTSIYGDEANAAADGQKGVVDNIVGLRSGKTFMAGQSEVFGLGYNIANEDFDRMVIATGSGAKNLDKRDTFAHEFGHLLGGPHHKLQFKEGLMRKGTRDITRGHYLTSQDFDMLLSTPSRKAVVGTGGPFPRSGSENQLIGGTFPATTNQVVRARTIKAPNISN